MPAEILTVTLNPTLDVSTSVPRLIDHAKLRCGPEQEQVGGGGINVAQVVHSLGVSCQALLPVGGSRGQDILQRLTKRGLDCIAVPIAQQSRQCFTVYETETGHEYRFVLPGPALSDAEQNACVAAICENLPTQYLVLSGSLPPGLPDDFYATVIHAVRHVNPALKIVVDTSGHALAHALSARVFLFKPSREEFCELLGASSTQKQRTPTDWAKACRTFISQGKAQVVALTLGTEGSLIVSATHAWRVFPVPVKVTSTVGAGDSFVGGLLWSLTQQATDWVQAAQVGTAAASAALQTQGELSFDAHTILSTSKTVKVLPLSE